MENVDTLFFNTGDLFPNSMPYYFKKIIIKMSYWLNVFKADCNSFASNPADRDIWYDSCFLSNCS